MKNLFFKLNLSGNNHQGKSNYQNTPGYAGKIQRISQTHFYAPFNKTTELYRHNIPYMVNLNNSNGFDGATNAATNHATAMFAKNSDNLSICNLFNTISITKNHITTA